jgi:hypothetical protein
LKIGFGLRFLESEQSGRPIPLRLDHQARLNEFCANGAPKARSQEFVAFKELIDTLEMV